MFNNYEACSKLASHTLETTKLKPDIFIMLCFSLPSFYIVEQTPILWARQPLARRTQLATRYQEIDI